MHTAGTPAADGRVRSIKPPNVEPARLVGRDGRRNNDDDGSSGPPRLQVPDSYWTVRDPIEFHARSGVRFFSVFVRDVHRFLVCPWTIQGSYIE